MEYYLVKCLLFRYAAYQIMKKKYLNGKTAKQMFLKKRLKTIKKVGI